jgi:hypothetical protein
MRVTDFSINAGSDAACRTAGTLPAGFVPVEGFASDANGIPDTVTVTVTKVTGGVLAGAQGAKVHPGLDAAAAAAANAAHADGLLGIKAKQLGSAYTFGAAQIAALLHPRPEGASQFSHTYSPSVLASSNSLRLHNGHVSWQSLQNAPLPLP